MTYFDLKFTKVFKDFLRVFQTFHLQECLTFGFMPGAIKARLRNALCFCAQECRASKLLSFHEDIDNF